MKPSPFSKGQRMYFGIGKFSIDESVGNGDDLRAFKAICQKISHRFKGNCVFRIQNGQPEIYLSVFAQNEHQIDQKFDKVAVFIEEDGLGRIIEESCLIEHVDNLTQE